MPKLLMLKGLPGSGKSTYARELVASQDYWRINKDDLRAMVHGSKHSKYKEKFILHWRDELVKDALGGGHNVVVDDTNFNPIHEVTLRAIAQVWEADFEVKLIDTSVEECIRRDLVRPNSVGERVIRQMYDQYLRSEPAPVPVIPHVPGAPAAVICDIDGTLAHMVEGGRSPYDWARVGEDGIDDDVRWALSRLDCKIIIVSGRDGVCRPETERWLRRHQVAYEELFMRAAGDKRKDSVVKEELYREHIEGKYNVRCVLDDRQQVVDQWRAMGLKCWQVAPGNF